MSGQVEPARIFTASGPRAVEAELLRRIGEALERQRFDVSLLARPVRLIVPSRSLRLHLARVLTSRFGAVAGVELATLHATALEILDRVGDDLPQGEALFPVIAQRCARAEPTLHHALDELVDGYEGVVAAMTDLVDAGFQPYAESGLLDCIAELPPGAERERAAALVRSATASLLAMTDRNLGHRSEVLRRAAERLAEHGAEALPARAVLVHGFSEATGVATDLIRALEQHRSACVLLDAPPPPGAAGAPDPDLRFGRRLRDAVTTVARAVESAPTAEPPAAANVSGLGAASRAAEVRQVAVRVRALLATGVAPESIGVVARDLAPYSLPLRLHFDRLAVPFSGVGAAGPGGSLRRRIEALVALLSGGPTTPTDRWLDARAERRPGETALLRLALRHRAAPRVEDAAAYAAATADAPTEGDVALPVQPAAADEDVADVLEPEPRRPQRHISRERWQRLVSEARWLCQCSEAWPDPAPAAEHAARLRELLVDGLGWSAADEASGLVGRQLDDLVGALPADEPLSLDELRIWLRRALEGIGADPLGGSGGGVQVLSVPEARARCFDHLFVVGMNRDAFPRSVTEDPLMPDRVRASLRTLLPELPVKRDGVDEERFLFAQLLASSPAVTLSWTTQDDAGKPLARSSLIERLDWAIPGFAADAPSEAPDGEGGDAVDAEGEASPRTAFELVIASGLRRPRAHRAALFEAALEERSWDVEAGLATDVRALAATRAAVLDELDRPPIAGSASLGPYFGFVGVATGAAPRSDAPLYVTRLEQLARCPWQSFLERSLHLEPTPDPMSTLPGVDALLLGSIVHSVLEEIAWTAGAGVRGKLAELDANAAVPVPWPQAEALERLLRRAAARALAVEGLALPGLVEAATRRALPLLERARQVDWAAGPPRVAAAEVEGSLEVHDAAGQPQRLHFRADRLDAGAEGWVLTDYKTGRLPSVARLPETRRRHLRDALRRGEQLQAGAYAFASAGGTGRYLHLRPQDDVELLDNRIDERDAEARPVFEGSVAMLLSLLGAGSYVPRMIDPSANANGDEGGPRCGTCAVAEACSKGDSGAHLRLRHWLEAGPADDASPAEQVARAWIERQALPSAAANANANANTNGDAR